MILELMRGFNHYFAIYLLLAAPGLLTGQNSAWFIDTYAGTDRPVKDGVAGTSSLLNSPANLVVDGSGNVIFADTNDHRVRKIAPNGIISTIAGSGVPGYAGDGGPAVSAKFISPQGLAIDASGNLYVSDYVANVVRMIDSTGTVTTVAGTGVAGNTGNGGKATSASLNGPFALAVDKAGTLYIAEDLNNAVRKVSPAGTISAFAGPVTYPEGLAIDSTGAVYIASWGDNKIYKASSSGPLTAVAGSGNAGFAGDGAAATAAALNGPQGIAFDSAGNLWICDSLNNRIREVTGGNIQTAIGSGYSGLSSIGPATSISVYLPLGIGVGANGTVYWTENGNHRVREYMTGNRQVTEIAGYTPPLSTTGAPSSLPLFNPYGTSTDSAGNLYIADTGNHVIRKVTPSGVSSVIAGTGNANFNGDVGTATAINLTYPQGVSVDAQGNVFIADSGNSRVRKVDPTGRITTVMGAGSGLPLPGSFDGNALLIYPTGVVATGNGSFVVVDEYFGIVAQVNNVGTISLIPTSNLNYLALPIGIAVSGSNIYIADTFDHRILKYNGSSTSIVAGTGQPGYSGDNGPATKATLFAPAGVAADASGNLYIADSYNNVIRMVDTTGKITTIAGSGIPGFSGDKGLAATAQFTFPTGINIDAAGNLEVADQLNQRIRILRYQQIPTDLTLQTDSSAKSANHGGSVTIQLSLTSIGGFAGSANVTVSAPGGLAVQFAPAVPVAIASGQTVAVTATVQIDAATAPGSYSVVFTVTSGSIQHTSTVTVTVTNLPQFTSASIVSAASYAGGGVAPGEIVAIYGQDMGPAAIALGSFDDNGQLSTQVGGTTVLFDNTPAPLVYSLAGQLSAIVPYEVAGQTATNVRIQYNGQTSPAISVPVTDAAPGIFTVPPGTQAAALNSDLSVNGANNPAKGGSAIVLFATGEGQTRPAGADGKLASVTLPKPVLPVTVTIGGQNATVLYYGAAPFEVAGVMQLNVQVPTGLPSGPAGVVLQVGTRVSGGASTIAIQ